jgi:hypothetical protein
MPEQRPPGDTAMAGDAEEGTATGCDTARVLALLTTFVGLLAVLAGIGCGAAAYSRTHAEHADVPLWPAMHRGGQAIRRVWVRYVLRRPGRHGQRERCSVGCGDEQRDRRGRRAGD